MRTPLYARPLAALLGLALVGCSDSAGPGEEPTPVDMNVELTALTNRILNAAMLPTYSTSAAIPSAAATLSAEMWDAPDMIMDRSASFGTMISYREWFSKVLNDDVQGTVLQRFAAARGGVCFVQSFDGFPKDADGLATIGTHEVSFIPSEQDVACPGFSGDFNDPHGVNTATVTVTDPGNAVYDRRFDVVGEGFFFLIGIDEGGFRFAAVNSSTDGGALVEMSRMLARYDAATNVSRFEFFGVGHLRAYALFRVYFDHGADAGHILAWDDNWETRFLVSGATETLGTPVSLSVQTGIIGDQYVPGTLEVLEGCVNPQTGDLVTTATFPSCNSSAAAVSLESPTLFWVSLPWVETPPTTATFEIPFANDMTVNFATPTEMYETAPQ